MPSRPAGNSGPVRAGIYCRISKADEGDFVKTDDQERICRELAPRIGWEVAEGVGYPHPDGVYTDHSKSAWQKNRKRPAWNQMLDDVADGKINGIIVYHGDRLVRRPEDLADLMRLASNKGVKLASPSGTRNLDTERLEPWIRAAFAEEESQRLSERRKAQYERMRRQGLTRRGGQGGRAFGFETDGVTHVPAEADAVREMAGRILAGESAYAVARDLTERGFRTPSGLALTSAVVMYVLRRPRTAGLMPDGESAAAWEPLLDRETWERVRLVLDARGKQWPGQGTNAVRHLLSGIAACGLCGRTLTIRYGRRNVAKGLEASVQYGCATPGCRKVTRVAAHLDAYVGARVVARLNNPLNPDGQAMPVDHAAEWKVLARERDEADAKLRDYRSSAGMLDALAARIDSIDARMAELRDLAAGDSRSRLIARYHGITREQWENDLSLDVKRALVAACFRVTVLPASKRGPGFRTEDVRVLPVS